MKTVSMLILGISAFMLSCTNTTKNESEHVDTLDTIDSLSDQTFPEASVDSFANDSLHSYPRGVPVPR